MAKNFFVMTGAATQADFVAVNTPAASFSNINAMAADQYYMYTANVGSWIKQGAAPVASAAAGSLYVPANTPVLIDGGYGAVLSVIYDGTIGKASLVRVKAV